VGSSQGGLAGAGRFGADQSLGWASSTKVVCA